MVPKTATSTETKTITRIIHYVDKVTNQNVKEDVVQPVTLSRTKTENKVTGVVTYGEWTTGNWDEVISGKIDKYKIQIFQQLNHKKLRQTLVIKK